MIFKYLNLFPTVGLFLKPIRRPMALLALALFLAGAACSKQEYGSTQQEGAPPDSLLSQGFKISADSLRALEQSQLSNEEIQNFYVEGVWYQRFLGDTQFRRIDEYDYDNLLDYPRETVFDVVLDLRDPHSFSLAQLRTKGLNPTREAGFYRSFMVREELRMLILNGINSYAAVVFERDER